MGWVHCVQVSCSKCKVLELHGTQEKKSAIVESILLLFKRLYMDSPNAIFLYQASCSSNIMHLLLKDNIIDVILML